jgi:DeoR/GlpR family transcriptional regulator of sugar metabolism
MKRDKNLMMRRRLYVHKTFIELTSNGMKFECAVKEISDIIFVSESTIWRDLAIMKSIQN